MKRYLRAGSEVNLTPLLDVLFSILFIVMMVGKSDLSSAQKNYQDQESQNVDLQQENEDLRDQLDTYNLYNSNVILVTVRNYDKDGNHGLKILQGKEEGAYDDIQLGQDKTENTKNRIVKDVEALLKDDSDDPVYIVYYCNRKKIYTDENKAVIEAFEGLSEEYKRVFFSIKY